MNIHPKNMAPRERQILCGLYLSKFDKVGLNALGFENFSEAFNALGYGLGARPASIKNYRDEFDPFFPNKRKGWHKRPLRPHCEKIMRAFGELSMDEFVTILNESLLPIENLKRRPDIKKVLQGIENIQDASFAKRLITGKAAEEYFAAHYQEMQEFTGLEITDTTLWGCGFDFKLGRPKEDTLTAVEVKGLQSRYGQIQFTSLEYEMAHVIGPNYYLVLVRNFTEDPFHTIYRDPLRSNLMFRRNERKEVRITWEADVSARTG